MGTYGGRRAYTRKRSFSAIFQSIHISNRSIMATHHPSRCTFESGTIYACNVFLCAGMCRGIDFLKRPKTRGRRLARVGRGPAAPTEWRARVARVGGARGGPYGQVHIARRPPWRRLRLTVWGGAGRSNQIARNGPKRAAGAQRAEVGIAFGPMLQ